MAKRTAVGLNEIRKLINIETKVLDTDQASAVINTTGTVYPISRIAQGLDYNNRVGDSIKLQHLESRVRIYQNTGATETMVRAIMFRDLDGYGTAPTTADVMQTVGVTLAPTTPLDWLNRERFSVLYDELFTFNSTGNQTACIVASFPHGGHVKYLGTTAAAASDGKGSVYWLFISDEATNTPSIAFSTRILFTDD